MLRLAMDSAGDLASGWAEEYDIHIIPVNIHFKERTYLQGVDLDNKGFYKLVEESGTIPKTSQPTPHQFVQFYERIAEVGDTILSIHVTSKLSGTYESAIIAARQLKDKFNVIPFDSTGGSTAQGYMLKEARQLDRSGSSMEVIMSRMEAIRDKLEIFLTLDTMEYARMSGRVKTLQAALASLLNIKPIVVLEDGNLFVGDKVRTRKKSLELILAKMKDKMGDQLVNMAVIHSEDLAAGKDLMERVPKLFNINELVLTDLSTGVAANLGPGTVGIVAYPV